MGFLARITQRVGRSLVSFGFGGVGGAAPAPLAYIPSPALASTPMGDVHLVAAPMGDLRLTSTPIDDVRVTTTV